jgi:hypothetical protein
MVARLWQTGIMLTSFQRSRKNPSGSKYTVTFNFEDLERTDAGELSGIDPGF